MTEAPATLTATRLMRVAEVLSLTGIKSRSTIYELQAGGDFPQAVRLTSKAIGFVESEIHAWIRSRVEARPEAATPATRPARLRHRTATTTQTTTRSSTASQSGATPPATTSTASTTAPPRRRGPARTRAQRQQAQGK